MLDRTRRLVAGVVDLAKDAVAPGTKVEEGRVRRRFRKAVAAVALVGLGVTGCSGSSDKKEEGARNSNAAEGQKPAGSGNGRLLIVLMKPGIWRRWIRRRGIGARSPMLWSLAGVWRSGAADWRGSRLLAN